VSVRVFSVCYLDELARQASGSPRRRQHRNIHTDYAEPCQRLFNAIEPDSYLRPHRHGAHQGPETMVAVRGRLTLVLFDDSGHITALHRFGAGRLAEQEGAAFGVEIAPGQWHTVIALDAGSILLEMKSGPFDPTMPKFPASWAPAESSPEATAYLATLMTTVRMLETP
jgi:cupin fold WbuC family metalloprotein